MSIVRSDKPFVLAGRTYQSRLLVGTGKYKDFAETRAAIDASGARVAISTAAIPFLQNFSFLVNPAEHSYVDPSRPKSLLEQQAQ